MRLLLHILEKVEYDRVLNVHRRLGSNDKLMKLLQLFVAAGRVQLVG